MTGETAEIPSLAEKYTFPDPFVLESGEVILAPEICYETFGTYSQERNNAVLLFHALSGDSHCSSHNESDSTGWWEECIGPGKTIDTDKLFVVCANTLGGCRGSSGPNSINPETGRVYGADFPEITIQDMVKFQALLLDYLKIPRLRCVIGSSMGGMMALQWGLLFPDSTSGIVVIASAHRLSTQALAFDIVGRNAILHDPEFHGGNYIVHNTTPAKGLAIARMIGHITYLSREKMSSKFESDRLKPRDIDTEFEKLFSVGSYLGYQGDKFVERFDANSFLSLTKAMDYFDLGNTPEELQNRFRDKNTNWLFITFSSDWLFPPHETEKTLKAVSRNNINASYCSFTTNAGHDAFLIPSVISEIRPLIQTFTESCSSEICSCTDASRNLRQDLQIIYSMIQPGSSVLDAGCGDGELLNALCQKNCFPLYGIDRNRNAVVSCLKNGIPAICKDIDFGLPWFSDKAFDYVVLSLTLQSMSHIKNGLKELLRIGRKVIVSFPNFAYYKLREHYYTEGKAPVSSGILKYSWYESPNIRFFSIIDFENLCNEMGILKVKSLSIDTESGATIQNDPNTYADMAIYMISIDE